MKTRLLGVLLIVALALDWVAGYLTYHFGDYREAGLYRVGADRSGARRPDPRYHHGLKPNLVATDSWGTEPYALVTNNLGFKDNTVRDVPLHPAGRRLVFIGDSFTEGVGVNYPQTWVGRVDRVLAMQGVDVLNAGVVSYSPKPVYYKIKALLEDGLRFDHLVYFIDLSDTPDELLFNDFVPANKDPDDTWSGRYIKTPYTPKSYEYSLTLRSVLRLMQRDPWERTVFTDARTGEHFLFDNEREAWARGRKPEWLEPAQGSATYYLTKLAALCAAHGITFEIAIYPWPQEIAANDSHSRYREWWRNFATEHGLACYDLHDVFFPADAAAREKILAEDFTRGDVHWSAAGHQLVADEWLRQYRRRHPNGW